MSIFRRRQSTCAERPARDPLMSLGRTMLKGSLWATLDSWASEIANLTFFLLLVRLLGPEEFGIVGLAMVFIGVTTDLVGHSVSRVLIQRRELTESLCNTVFLLILGLAAGTAVLMLGVAPLIGDLFGVPSLIPILRWLSLSLVLHALAAVPLAILSREMRFDAIAKRSLAMIGGGGLVGITMALSGQGAFALVGQIVTQSVISAVMLYGASTWRPRLRGSVDDLRAIRSYASSVVGNRLMIQFDERAPQFVIGLVMGPTAVGYYNIAMRLVDILIRMFVVPVNQVALPGIAQVQKDPDQVRGILKTGIAAASLLSCPAFMGTIVIAPDLLPLVAGAEWQPAVLVLQLLALRGLLWPVMLYSASLLYGTGRPEVLLKLNLIDLVANVILLCLAAPFGLAAVAAASSARILLVRWPLMGAALKQTAGIGLIGQTLLMAPALAAGALMSVLLLLARLELGSALEGAALTATLIALGAICYPAFALMLRPSLAHEVAGLLQSLRGRMSQTGG